VHKLLVVILSLFYLVFSTGFTKYKHLCKGTSITLYSFSNTQEQSKDKPCSICSLKEKDLNQLKDGCCKHESQEIKLDDSIKKQSNFDLSVKFWGDAIPNKMLGTVFEFSVVDTEIKKSPIYTSTKISIQSNPLYILHCVYRI